MIYFSMDAETDGLYGEVFAIGAAVVSEDGSIIDRFAGKCIAPGIDSQWVRENCLPHLSALPDFESRLALREAFWAFYLRWRAEGAVPIADVACPVEAGLLRACVQENLPEREFLGPFPLIDVASVLFAKGVDPDVDRRAYSGYAGNAHNPLDDAIASALCLLRAIRVLA